MVHATFREPNAARAGGYVLILAGILVAFGLLFHPPPSGGFEEDASILSDTPIWGAIHVAIAFGFVLCVLGGLLILVSGGMATSHWLNALFWGALTVGMVYFTGVAMINGWVMHPLVEEGNDNTALFDTMNHLIIGFGWLGNPLFLLGLTGLTVQEYRFSQTGMRRGVALTGVVVTVLSWGRGIGSATGLYFLEPLIFASVPAFLWLSYFGFRIAQLASTIPPST
jgi:hypothetical protein